VAIRASAYWLHSLVVAVLPSIEPIRPIRAKAVPIGREWVYEVKLDGFRGTLYVGDGRAFFRSKTMRMMPRFDALALQVAGQLGVRDAILDGEIVTMGKGGPDFYRLMFRRGEPRYIPFDLMWLNGRDFREKALAVRKRALQRITSRTSIVPVEAFPEPRLFEATVQLDMEGIVAKRKSDPYAAETKWFKVKHSAYSQNVDRWELFRR
jgi:bifunctional non-homologous end joining protein LigD